MNQVEQKTNGVKLERIIYIMIEISIIVINWKSNKNPAEKTHIDTYLLGSNKWWWWRYIKAIKNSSTTISTISRDRCLSMAVSSRGIQPRHRCFQYTLHIAQYQKATPSEFVAIDRRVAKQFVINSRWLLLFFFFFKKNHKKTLRYESNQNSKENVLFAVYRW